MAAEADSPTEHAEQHRQRYAAGRYAEQEPRAGRAQITVRIEIAWYVLKLCLRIEILSNNNFELWLKNTLEHPVSKALL